MGEAACFTGLATAALTASKLAVISVIVNGRVCGHDIDMPIAITPYGK